MRINHAFLINRSHMTFHQTVYQQQWSKSKIWEGSSSTVPHKIASWLWKLCLYHNQPLNNLACSLHHNCVGFILHYTTKNSYQENTWQNQGDVTFTTPPPHPILDLHLGLPYIFPQWFSTLVDIKVICGAIKTSSWSCSHP